MYINNKKRKLDAFDLDVLQNADYFTCVYYKPRDKSLRIEYGTYKEANFSQHVLYLPLIDFCLTIYKEDEQG